MKVKACVLGLCLSISLMVGCEQLVSVNPVPSVPPETSAKITVAAETAETKESSSNLDCVQFDLKTGRTIFPSGLGVLFGLKDCQGNPMPKLEIDELGIREDNQSISPFEISQTLLPRHYGFEMQTVLLLDMSGSVVRSGNLGALQQATRQFVEKVSEEQKIAIYAFDGSADIVLLQAFTQDKTKLSAAIEGLTRFELRDPSSNLNGAIVNGLSVLDTSLKKARPPVKDGTLVIFTDGKDQASRIGMSELMATISSTQHSIFSIGLGDDVDPQGLRVLAKNGTQFVDNGSGLRSAFEQIANTIQTRSKSYYVLAYCSPRRAGDHTLELSVRGKKKGTLNVNFSAHGFQAGCNPQDIKAENFSNAPTEATAPSKSPSSI